MIRLNIVIMILSTSFLGCSQNSYSNIADDSCNCFEENIKELESGIDNKISKAFEECLNKNIEKIHEAEKIKQKSGKSNIDHLFQLSIEFTIKLKASCEIFNQFSKDFIRIEHKKKEGDKNLNQNKKKNQTVLGTIKAIKRYNAENIEFNLLTLDDKSLTFYYKNINDSYIDKVFEVEFEEKTINGELILWCKKLNIKE